MPVWVVSLVMALVKVGIQWLEKHNAKAETSKPVDRDVVTRLRERVRSAEDRASRARSAGEDRPVGEWEGLRPDQ